MAAAGAGEEVKQDENPVPELKQDQNGDIDLSHQFYHQDDT